MIMTKVRESEKRLKESIKERLVQTITKDWGFTYNEGKFAPTCQNNEFWYKDLGNDTFLVIDYGCKDPKRASYAFDLFRCIYPANAILGNSKPLSIQKLKLSIDLEEDKGKMEKIFNNPLIITESEVWEE